MESGEDMFETKDTVFASGRILTQEMLNLLYDWPRQAMVQLSCHGLAEGVLCGMEYEAASDDLFIQPGILWQQGEFWFLRQKLSLKELCQERCQEGQRYFLQLLPETKAIQGNVTTRLMEIRVEESKGKEDFGSFCYHAGMIPSLPSSWEEVIESLHNIFYLNLSQLPWAAPEEATFHPLIFSCLAQALEKKSRRSALESAMLVQLYEKGTLTMKTLRLYTGDSCGVSREDLLKHIDQALQREDDAAPHTVTTPEAPQKTKRISNQRGMI